MAPATFHHAPVADALRANPGEWAVVAESPANCGLGWLIKNGRLKCWQPAGTFQSATRTVNGKITVYARYVGGVTS